MKADKSETFDGLACQLKQQAGELKERKLAVFLIQQQRVSIWRDQTFTEIDGKLARQISDLTRTSDTLLVGLDGGIKARYSDFDLSAIFADIDQMPMRRAEINRKRPNQ